MGVVNGWIQSCLFPLPFIPSRQERGKWTFYETIKFSVYLFLRVHTAQTLGAGAYVRKPYVIEKLGLAVRNEIDRVAC